MDAMALLQALLEATEYYETNDRYAGRWGDAFVKVTNADGLKPPLLGDARNDRPTSSQIDDLTDRGFVRSVPSTSGGVERKFVITDAGRRAARAAQAPSGPDAVDLRWPSVARRLGAFVDAYELASSPERGISAPENRAAAPHFRELVRTGYIEETELSMDQAPTYRPTLEGYRTARSWPSRDAALVRQAEAIATALEMIDNESKGAQTVGEAVRASRGVVIEVIGKALAEIATSGT
jgi:hypothetical protein